MIQNRWKLLLLLFCYALRMHGQNSVFDEFDFDSGEYTLIGTLSESNKNGLQDSLGAFYTSDIEVLKEFKKEWVFTEESPFYFCGYHYIIRILKKGENIEEFFINLNCNMISTQKGYYRFDSKKLRLFLGRLNKLQFIYKELKSLKEGRLYLDSIARKTNLIFVQNPKWKKFDGEFEFIYPCDSLRSEESCGDLKKEILEKIILEFHQKYPEETFELLESGGGTKSLFITVKCNQTLAEQFSGYKLTWNKFSEYHPSLRTWWSQP